MIIIPPIFLRPFRGALPDTGKHEPNYSKFKIIETGHKKYLIKDSDGLYLYQGIERIFWVSNRDGATEYGSLNKAKKVVEWLIKHYSETEL